MQKLTFWGSISFHNICTGIKMIIYLPRNPAMAALNSLSRILKALFSVRHKNVTLSPKTLQYMGFHWNNCFLNKRNNTNLTVKFWSSSAVSVKHWESRPFPNFCLRNHIGKTWKRNIKTMRTIYNIKGERKKFTKTEISIW